MRQFILEKQPSSDGLVHIIGKDYRYLRQVLRVKNGDMLSLRLPDGSLKNSTVAFVDENAKKITLQLCADSGFEYKSITRGVHANQIQTLFDKNEYWLFQFIPRPQKFEQIVRQATECGITNIVPIIGEYCEKISLTSFSENKLSRLEKIIKEARQQSGSPVQTKIFEPMSLEQAIDLWNKETSEGTNLGFVLSERDENSPKLSQIISSSSGLKKICIAIGNEGGISPAEVELLKTKGLFYPLHFSVNILRCETAALYGIAAIQSTIQDFVL